MNDAEIVTRISVNAKEFDNIPEALRKVQGQVTVAASEVERELNRFTTASASSGQQIVRAYGNQVDKVAGQTRELIAVQNAATAAAGRQRAGYQQLGFQISDIASQAAVGTNAFVIFAQQGNQVAFALSQFGGQLGRVAGFLTGPWGAAVLGAVSILGLLATRKREVAEAADDAAGQFDATRLASLDLAQATKELNALTGNSVLSIEEQIGALKAVAEAKRQDAIATRQQIQAEIDKQIAIQRELSVAQTGPGNFGAGFAIAGAQQERRVAELQAQRREQDVLISEAESAAAAAEKKLQDIRTEAAKKGTEARAKVERSGVDQSAKLLREAERVREQALDRELRKIAEIGRERRAQAEEERRLRGEDVSELFDRRFVGPSITDVISRGTLGTPIGQDGLNEIFIENNRALERAGFSLVESAEKTADRFERDGLQAAANIAQAFGVRVGGEVGRIAFLLSDVLGGEFSSFGGRDSPLGRAFKSTFDPLADEIEKLVSQIDIGLGKAGSSALSGALTGAAIGSAVGGNKESAIGGAIGGAAGSAIGFAVGGPIGAAIGNAIGSLIGSGIGGLFASPKKGAAIIGSSGGEATIAGFSGNNSGQRSQAGTLGGSVVNTLNAIADQLGAQIGQFAVSIGKVNDTFSVDPTGRGNVSKRFGVTQFGTAEEAVRFAVLDAVRDGAITGVSQTVQNALRRAGDIEKGLQDALTIQSVADRVAQFEDPIGFAIRRLDREFDSLRKTLNANSATVEELADLESLYNREREALVKDSLRTLTEFRDSLLAGSSSPLSLRAQQAEAEARFGAFERDLAAGVSIDQQAFVAAGQLLLDVERQISGGTADFFAQFNRVRAGTDQAIVDLQNSIPLRDQLAERTAVAGESTAESMADAVNLLQQIDLRLAAMGGGDGGRFDSDIVANGFARA